MLGHEVVAVEHGQAGDTGVHPQGTSQTKPEIQEIQEIYRRYMRYRRYIVIHRRYRKYRIQEI